MISGNLYRHRRCLDVDIYICQRLGANRYRIKYWNRNWCLFHDGNDIVTINDTSDWEELP